MFIVIMCGLGMFIVLIWLIGVGLLYVVIMIGFSIDVELWLVWSDVNLVCSVVNVLFMWWVRLLVLSLKLFVIVFVFFVGFFLVLIVIVLIMYCCIGVLICYDVFEFVFGV